MTLRSAVAVLVAVVGLLVGARWQHRLEYLPLAAALAIPPREILGGGMRLPLGLLTGAAVAGLWCRLVGAPWRAVGDALAVGACVLIALGRLGCLAAGCCMGAPCPSWLSWCPRHPAGSEIFAVQVFAHQLDAAAATSLPAHPLPAYFALGALATLGLLLWLLHRDVRPGGLLLAFTIVRPATKLALESLRAEPRPQLLMVGIPLIVLAVAVGVAVRGGGRHRDRRRAAPARRGPWRRVRGVP